MAAQINNKDALRYCVMKQTEGDQGRQTIFERDGNKISRSLYTLRFGHAEGFSSPCKLIPFVGYQHICHQIVVSYV